MRETIATIVGTVICLASLTAWCYTAPANGSGWILIAAFLGTLGLLDSIRKAGLATAANVLISVASGAAWWFHRDLPSSRLVLALSILCALNALCTISVIVHAETQRK